MPGPFSLANRPKRPGAYFNWVATLKERVLPGVGATVALPFTHDWGPLETPTLITSFAEFQAVFGDSVDTPGYRAAKYVFMGEGLPGRSGAAAAVCYRIGGSAAAKATKALTNTTPATALTLTALYEGSRGNDLTVTVQDYAADSAKTELILYLDGLEVERYRFADTNIADAATQINASSNWVTAVANVTGVALTLVTGSTFASGNDGSTLVSGDWTTTMTSLGSQRWAIFAPYDLTDGSILSSVKTWISDLNAAGKRCQAVVGGLADETASTANTRSGTLNTEEFINLGVGSLRDADTNIGTISTAQFVPRYAGALARRRGQKSMSGARFIDMEIVAGATDAEILLCFDAGTTVFVTDSHPTAPVRCEKGLTTYTTTGSAAKPYVIFRNPKYVRTMQDYEMRLSDWFTENMQGEVVVSDATRSALITKASEFMKDLEALGEIQPEWTVEVAQDPPPSDDDEFIHLRYGMKFGRSLEQVFNTVNFA